MTIEEIHHQVLRELEENPLPWDSRMSHWLSEEKYLSTLEANSQRYYLYLNALARVLQPKNVLELGACVGGSAFFMMLALPGDGRLTTVDIGDRHPWQLGPYLDDPRLRRVVGNDLDLSIYRDLPPTHIDLLFVDTVHEYDHARRELELYLPMLVPSAVIAFDDIHINDGMNRLWNELTLPKVDGGGEFHWSGFGIAYPAKLSFRGTLRKCMGENSTRILGQLKSANT